MSFLEKLNHGKPLSSTEKVVLLVFGVVAFFMVCPMAFLLILAGSWMFWTSDSVSSSTSGIGLFISQIWPYIVVGFGIVALLVIGAKILKKQEKKSKPEIAAPAEVIPEPTAAPVVSPDVNAAKPAKSSNTPVVITIILICVALIFSPYLVIMVLLFMIWSDNNPMLYYLVGLFVALLIIIIATLKKKKNKNN